MSVGECLTSGAASKQSKTFCSDYARHPATSRPYTALQSTSPRRRRENSRASSMTQDGKQMHEYEGTVDEYGAINAYVKVTGRSHLSRTILRRQDLHLTGDNPFRVQRFSVRGGKDLQVAEVDRTANRAGTLSYRYSSSNSNTQI
ncbi:hypothetical protein VE03_05015 [Pseudogymnoascus sp. 23342-1-I1]|nr:hypothetical protein VE03_05015 [Pseudogymnoascus sp. 23342-1-I1]